MTKFPKAPGVYKITNIKNNKFYIGSTTNLYLRKNAHWCCLKNNKHENQYIQNSWNKCGEKFFVFEIVLLCSKETLLEEEQKILEKYFDNQNMCYNISPTAQNCLGVKHSDTTKKERSKTMLGPKNHFYGKVHSQETKNKISVLNRGKLSGKRNPMFGKTGEKHPSYGMRGIKHHASKKIIQIDPRTNHTVNVYESMREAERVTNISHVTIGRCCNGKLKTSGGFVWKYTPTTDFVQEQ